MRSTHDGSTRLSDKWPKRKQRTNTSSRRLSDNSTSKIRCFKYCLQSSVLRCYRLCL
ncbi:hypothetical protein PanWU01x14_058510 [Parasponia andersonii]|uniref:Uncharacterized protein n=1 Tax=Parasponia andersonii TaxID=3476 RepID=A0A2P5DJ75_PARAD|nr:hypothetical protein PanWU01x14_058510 [Parasponia andersonii]